MAGAIAPAEAGIGDAIAGVAAALLPVPVSPLLLVLRLLLPLAPLPPMTPTLGARTTAGLDGGEGSSEPNKEPGEKSATGRSLRLLRRGALAGGASALMGLSVDMKS